MRRPSATRLLAALLLAPAGAALAEGPPVAGNRALASAQSAMFDSCTSVFVDAEAGTAECNNPVYARDGTPRSTTQRGEWARSSSLAFPGNVAVGSFFPAQDKPWWWGPYESPVNQAAARAQADGRKLRASAMALDSSDAGWRWSESDQRSCRACSAFGLRGIDEYDNFSAAATATFVDRFRADTNGRAMFIFRLDGSYESGNDGFFQSAGGKFAFSAALYDRNQVVTIEDPDFRRTFLTQVSYASVGFGRSGRGLFPSQPLPSLGDHVGDELLEEFNPAFNRSAQEIDPATLQWKVLTPGGFPGSVALPGQAGEDTPFDRWYAVALDVTEGQQLTLAASLWVSATGWDRCDDKPGDGGDPQCGIGRTVVDFGQTAELTAVVLSDGLTLSGSELGIDYMALTTPIPEPSSWALMLAGGAGVLAWARRRLRQA